MNSNAKTILGILAAGAVGVAIGMLLAPEKGTDLRKSIKDQVDGLGDKLTDLINEGKEYLSDGKEKIADAVDEIKTHANGVKKEVKTGIDHTKQAFS